MEEKKEWEDFEGFLNRICPYCGCITAYNGNQRVCNKCKRRYGLYVVKNSQGSIIEEK